MSEQSSTGDSRRSFMAKSALATGALAMGTAGFGTATVGAQEDRVAVFAVRYYPGADFDVIAQLETSTTVEVLQDEGETVPEISQPDEWTGHIVRYDIGAEAGITTFLFLRDQSLSAGDSGTLGTDASVLSAQLGLLNTSLNGNGVDDDDDMDDETEDENGVDDDDDMDDETEDENGTGNDTEDENGTGNDTEEENGGA